MRTTGKRLPAAFFTLESGREPVREWLKTLSPDEKHEIGIDIGVIEYGWPIGMPTCEPLGDGLFTVRTKLPTKKIARVIFCLHDRKMVLLHGFIKKSQQMPDKELELARHRMAELKGARE